jgi:hypothetical protein
MNVFQVSGLKPELGLSYSIPRFKTGSGQCDRRHRHNVVNITAEFVYEISSMSNGELKWVSQSIRRWL